MAEDIEPDIQGERLELLTVVRGLEALDQPVPVTLMTPSIYVREGIRYGLAEWRRNGWRWESFGQMVPVKNCDLWQRVGPRDRFPRGRVPHTGGSILPVRLRLPAVRRIGDAESPPATLIGCRPPLATRGVVRPRHLRRRD